jgi:hypothetical protein
MGVSYRAFTKATPQSNLGCRTINISFLRQQFYMFGLYVKEWVSIPVPVNHGVNSLIFELFVVCYGTSSLRYLKNDQMDRKCVV